MQTLNHLLLNGKSKSEKAAEAANDQARDAQQRAAYAAQEDAAVTATQTQASGRALRTGGRRALAFMGSELGVPGSLAPTGA